LTRRDFLKRLGVSSLALPLLPSLIREVLYAEEPTAKQGFVRPKKAYYYAKRKNKVVQCFLCPKKCVVPKGQRGYCEVRENRDGEYYTLVYGNPCAVHIDPIEKKPLFHVLPGTRAFSIATAGCNFDCKYCQNWEISQVRPEATYNFDLPPYKIVRLASEYNCKSIAYTYTEPSIFYEYMLDTAIQAKRRGILNLYHSNGFLNRRPLLKLIKYLDAANIDLKGFTQNFYSEICEGELQPVLDTIKTLKRKGVWVEITNLVIPTKNDNFKKIREMCEWIKREVGDEVPLHFSRFYPMYKLKDLPPTPVPTLERARNIALKVGLKFVYIGNVFGHPAENTYCPRCKKVVIRRKGYNILELNLRNGRCKFCGRKIPGIWQA